MTIPKFAGKEMVIAGETKIVPGLSVKQMRHFFDPGSKNFSLLTNITGTPTAAHIDVLLDVTAAALSRNYPEIDQEWLAENVAPGELTTLVFAVLEGSGLMHVAPQEAGKEHAP